MSLILCIALLSAQTSQLLRFLLVQVFVPAGVATPTRSVLVYFHGGGFVKSTSLTYSKAVPLRLDVDSSSRETRC